MLKKLPICFLFYAEISEVLTQYDEINRSFSLCVQWVQEQIKTQNIYSDHLFSCFQLAQSRNIRVGAKVRSHWLTIFYLNCPLKVKEIIHEVGFTQCVWSVLMYHKGFLFKREQRFYIITIQNVQISLTRSVTFFDNFHILECERFSVQGNGNAQCLILCRAMAKTVYVDFFHWYAKTHVTYLTFCFRVKPLWIWTGSESHKMLFSNVFIGFYNKTWKLSVTAQAELQIFKLEIWECWNV